MPRMPETEANGAGSFILPSTLSLNGMTRVDDESVVMLATCKAPSKCRVIISTLLVNGAVVTFDTVRTKLNGKVKYNVSLPPRYISITLATTSRIGNCYVVD